MTHPVGIGPTLCRRLCNLGFRQAHGTERLSQGVGTAPSCAAKPHAGRCFSSAFGGLPRPTSSRHHSQDRLAWPLQQLRGGATHGHDCRPALCLAVPLSRLASSARRLPAQTNRGAAQQRGSAGRRAPNSYRLDAAHPRGHWIFLIFLVPREADGAGNSERVLGSGFKNCGPRCPSPKKKRSACSGSSSRRPRRETWGIRQSLNGLAFRHADIAHLFRQSSLIRKSFELRIDR
jgi:hypothetical protein